MSDWFTFYTLVAFILGVMLSAVVKAMVGRVRGAV